MAIQAVCNEVLPGERGTTAPRMNVRDALILAKPRVTSMIMITTLLGARFASAERGSIFWLDHKLWLTLSGTALLSAGAATLNQCLEVGTDGLMKRTASRPLPAGRVQMYQAVLLGAAFSLSGLAVLFCLPSAAAAVLGLFTSVIYLIAYTRVKPLSTLAVVPGAIAGALPPVIGYAGLSGTTSPSAWALFLILFYWQFPHLYAIAWMYQEDYARAGLKMLPKNGQSKLAVGRAMLGTFSMLAVATLVPIAAHLVNHSGLVPVLVLDGIYLASILAFVRLATYRVARKVLLVSVLYLPLLIALFWLQRIS
ncbi:protoheme IX farnesyltransferase [Granulicella sp. L60]|uniref:protoheme IX farnesyltransferase n=1 Tax=Granulicella sp. L60 TaxID=1641866 RepID=UPI00131ABC74|nr:protoheme IX farnesyltransferase [Granulicella sp. L60]